MWSVNRNILGGVLVPSDRMRRAKTDLDARRLGASELGWKGEYHSDRAYLLVQVCEMLPTREFFFGMAPHRPEHDIPDALVTSAHCHQGLRPLTPRASIKRYFLMMDSRRRSGTVGSQWLAKVEPKSME